MVIALEVKSGKGRSTKGLDVFTKKDKTAQVILVGGKGLPADLLLKNHLKR